MKMFCITYTAFGRNLKEYTWLKEEDVEFALSVICPTFQNFNYFEASEQDYAKLSSPILVLPEKTLTLKHRQVVRRCQVRRYRGQDFPKKRCYARTHNISFFEESLSKIAYHIPELGIFLK